MARPRLRINANFGLSNLGSRSNIYPSDPDFLADVSEQVKALTQTLNDIFRQFEEASEDIMLEALKPTLEKARDVYCPVDSGALRASAYLVKAPFRGKPRVEIGFARGGSPPYAIWVHELPGNHRHPTRWKFLETAVKEDLGDIYVRIGQLYKEFMGAGNG